MTALLSAPWITMAAQRVEAQLMDSGSTEVIIQSTSTAIKAVYDNTKTISVTATDIIGLRNPWGSISGNQLQDVDDPNNFVRVRDTPVKPVIVGLGGTGITQTSTSSLSNLDARTLGGDQFNYYGADGKVLSQWSLQNASSQRCLTAASLSAACAEEMPLISYGAEGRQLADFYAIRDAKGAFQLAISTSNPDQPSPISAAIVPVESQLIGDLLPGASRYEVVLGGGNGMIQTTNANGAVVLDASQATAGAKATIVTTSTLLHNPNLRTAEQTQTIASVEIQAPKAIVNANRVNSIQAAGENVNAIGQACQIAPNGQASGSYCTTGIIATAIRRQVWDPNEGKVVTLTQPRLVDATYQFSDKTVSAGFIKLYNLQADTNQNFQQTCSESSGCAFALETVRNNDGTARSVVVPRNELPTLFNDGTRVLLPSYSSQSIVAGGQGGPGLELTINAANGSGNRMSSGGFGTTVQIQTTETRLYLR